MTHISKNQLAPDHMEQLFLQLGSIMSLLSDKTAPDFLGDLLGDEEKIMLAKRLAAIAMFIEGNSSYRVWQLLKISPSTADKIRLNYEIGKYQNIELTLKSHKSTYRQFWKTLEIILQAGMPPMGRGRWKSVFK
jgi:uncharacterized protein YerC